MSRRSVLSATEQASLLALPEIQDDLIRSLYLQRVRLSPHSSTLVIQWIASQVKTDPGAWRKYGERNEKRREHFQEL